jgi:SOS-response transcriptional repressor LexA
MSLASTKRVSTGAASAEPMSPISTQGARFFILTLAPPGEAAVNAGVLLEDARADRLYIRLRRDWEALLPEEAEVLAELQADLEARARELGAAQLLEHLSDTLSNLIEIGGPREALVENFERALARLYREHVRSEVRPYRTHLPRYSLAVAAGKFLDNEEVAEEGWEEIPAAVRPREGMFIARIVGRSMEPRIPDGSLCVFRRFGAGSREGRLVLVEKLGGGANDRYTVKRYRSTKAQRPDGTWEHERIHLEPLNPEFEAWDLDPEENRFRILAEFVSVLD